MIQSHSRQTSQIFVSRAGWYSVRYPTEWTVEENETCAELCDPEHGVGALHISAYRTAAPVDPAVELLADLSNNRPIEAKDVAVTFNGTMRTASFEAICNDAFQKTWYISDKSYLVLVTYDCSEECKDREIDLVEDVVGSIELEPKISRN